MTSQNAKSFERDLTWAALNNAALSYVHPDWVVRTRYPGLMHYLSQSRRTRVYSSRQLREDFALKPLPEWGEGDFPVSILQRGLPGVTRFVFHIGLIGYSEIVRRSIDGRFKRQFWSLVGEQGYLFVSKRAALYNPGLIVRFIPSLQTGDSSITQDDILQVGLRVLSVILKQYSEEVVRRVNLMFPVSVIEANRQCGEVTLDTRELSILNRMLLKLLNVLDEKS